MKSGLGINRRKLLYVLVTTFWAVMMVSLVRRDLLPAIPRPMSGEMSFESVLAATPLPYSSRMAIYFGEKKVGYADTTIEKQTAGWYRVGTNVTAEAPLPFGENVRFRIFGHLILDERFQLRSLRLSFSSPIYRADMSGTVDLNQLELTIESDGTTWRRKVPIDTAQLMSNSFFPFVRAPWLRPGESWTISLLNPVTFETEQVVAKVERTEKMTVSDKEETVHVVVMNYAGQELRAWVTRDGEVVRQETSLGLKMIREEPRDQPE